MQMISIALEAYSVPSGGLRPQCRFNRSLQLLSQVNMLRLENACSPLIFAYVLVHLTYDAAATALHFLVRSPDDLMGLSFLHFYPDSALVDPENIVSGQSFLQYTRWRSPISDHTRGIPSRSMLRRSAPAVCWSVRTSRSCTTKHRLSALLGTSNRLMGRMTEKVPTSLRQTPNDEEHSRL
jgi:hypothetical protein